MTVANIPKFEKPSRIFRLRFEDPEMHGLVIEAKSGSMAGFMEIAKLSDLVDPSKRPQDFTAEDITKLDPLFDHFAASILNWNLTDEGKDIPCTKAGLLSLDIDFLLTIIGAWAEAIGGVSAPLGIGSLSGEKFQEASLPMAPLSESRVS